MTHQILHLPHKINVINGLRHIWDVISNARSQSSHPPTSPNTAPATKSWRSRFARKIPEVLPPIERRFDHNPRIIRRYPRIKSSSRTRRFGDLTRPSLETILYCKIQHFASPLSPKMSRSAAPVTKSHPPTSPNTDWSVTWLICYLTDLLLDWSVTWLICYLTDLLLDWSVTWLICYLTDLLLAWSVTCLICYLTDLLLDWSVTWLICYLTDLLLDWSVTWLIFYLTDLLLDGSFTWLNCYFTDLLLYWSVTWLICYLTDLLLDWSFTWRIFYLTELLLHGSVTLLICYFTDLLL